MTELVCPNCGHDKFHPSETVNLICCSCNLVWVPSAAVLLAAPAQDRVAFVAIAAAWFRERLIALRAAKDCAIGAERFELASELRDHERRLTSQRRLLTELSHQSPDALAAELPPPLVINTGERLKVDNADWLRRLLGAIDLHQAPTVRERPLILQVMSLCHQIPDLSSLEGRQRFDREVALLIDGLGISADDWRTHRVIVLSDSWQHASTEDVAVHAIADAIARKSGRPIGWMFFGNGIDAKHAHLMPSVWEEETALRGQE
jgi:hypothetical protein